MSNFFFCPVLIWWLLPCRNTEWHHCKYSRIPQSPPHWRWDQQKKCSIRYPPINVHNNMPLRSTCLTSTIFTLGICHSLGCVYLCTIGMCTHLCVNRLDEPASFVLYLAFSHSHNIMLGMWFWRSTCLFTGNLSFHWSVDSSHNIHLDSTLWLLYYNNFLLQRKVLISIGRRRSFLFASIMDKLVTQPRFQHWLKSRAEPGTKALSGRVSGTAYTNVWDHPRFQHWLKSWAEPGIKALSGNESVRHSLH